MIERQESHYLVDGPVGEIETVLAEPNTNEDAGVSRRLSVGVIICHPHPLHGGTMQNKVVTTLSRALVRRGHTVVRFNFRGVGKSAGTFAKGQGEQDDLRAVIAWFKGNYSFDQIWLIGFSFGAYVAASVANEAKADLCVSVAPAVDRYDFGSIQRGPYPWWVIQGDQDDVVDPSLVYDWYEILEGAKQLIRIPEAGHYFHGQLIAMRDTFLRMLDESSPPNPKNS